jgi:hypothetical protein
MRAHNSRLSSSSTSTRGAAMRGTSEPASARVASPSDLVLPRAARRVLPGAKRRVCPTDRCYGDEWHRSVAQDLRMLLFGNFVLVGWR